MTKAARRIVVPLAVGAVALLLLLAVVFGSRTPSGPDATDDTPAIVGDQAEQPDPGAGTDPAAGDDQPDAVAAEPQPQTPIVEAPIDAPAPEGLHAVAPTEGVTGEADLIVGSLDRTQHMLELRLSPIGAGIESITQSDIWKSAKDKRDADAHYAALADGAAEVPPLPPRDRNMQVATAIESKSLTVLSAGVIKVNGAIVYLDTPGTPNWAPVGRGTLQSVVVGDDGTPMLRLTRRFVLGSGYDFTIEQRIENLTDEPLQIEWQQYGPRDLELLPSSYIDRRRLRVAGKLPDSVDPTRTVRADEDMLTERNDLVDADAGSITIWPNKISAERGYILSWLASVNRYFALVVHPPLEDVEGGRLTIDDVVNQIVEQSIHVDGGTSLGRGSKGADRRVVTQLLGPARTVAPGATVAMDLGVFAGPMERRTLTAEKLDPLNLDQLILYQMSSCCAICTFQWLANLLIRFLSMGEMITGDWGVAIILLVCLVRLILHPLTKKAQINMQRFSKQMTTLKPEIDKLQKKYAGDSKKLQAEQMRLMREHGVNPLQMLGCLPMFLQTPIWIALYAMLYFAIEIRHEPAFYGIFQKISGGRWSFLGDLSSPDAFITLFSSAKTFSVMGMMFDYTSINILPILMGVLFFIQHKYMTPPTTGQSKEMQQQQKIMKVMMVIMMPVFLYAAPSGLTLYILTSSTIGILESRYIRSHIKDLEENPKKASTSKKKSKRRDMYARAYAAAQERMEQKRKAAQQKPQSFKKRKKK